MEYFGLSALHFYHQMPKGTSLSRSHFSRRSPFGNLLLLLTRTNLDVFTPFPFTFTVSQEYDGITSCSNARHIQPVHQAHYCQGWFQHPNPKLCLVFGQAVRASSETCKEVFAKRSSEHTYPTKNR
jgi:hypothetical protein